MTPKSYLSPEIARKSATRGREKGRVGHSNNRRVWSQHEDDYIREHYQTTPYDTLGEEIGVTGETIKKRMVVLGLSRKNLSSGGAKLSVTKKEREEYEASERRQSFLNKRW